MCQEFLLSYSHHCFSVLRSSSRMPTGSTANVLKALCSFTNVSHPYHFRNFMLYFLVINFCIIFIIHILSSPATDASVSSMPLCVDVHGLALVCVQSLQGVLCLVVQACLGIGAKPGEVNIITVTTPDGSGEDLTLPIAWLSDTNPQVG